MTEKIQISRKSSTRIYLPFAIKSQSLWQVWSWSFMVCNNKSDIYSRPGRKHIIIRGTLGKEFPQWMPKKEGCHERKRETIHWFEYLFHFHSSIDTTAWQCVLWSPLIANMSSHVNSQQWVRSLNYSTLTQNISLRKAACVQRNRYHMPPSNVPWNGKALAVFVGPGYNYIKVGILSDRQSLSEHLTKGKINFLYKVY